jgi:hypothetical protein
MKQSREESRSKGTMNEPSEYPFTYLKETITVRMAKHDVSHRSA